MTGKSNWTEEVAGLDVSASYPTSPERRRILRIVLNLEKIQTSERFEHVTLCKKGTRFNYPGFSEGIPLSRLGIINQYRNVLEIYIDLDKDGDSSKAYAALYRAYFRYKRRQALSVAREFAKSAKEVWNSN